MTTEYTYNPIFTKTKKQSCNHCFKEYHNKTAFDRHVILCEIYNESKEKDSPTIYTKKQLSMIVQELVFKFKKVETEVSETTTWMNYNKKKWDVISWLNKNIIFSPTTSASHLNDWISVFLVTENHIQVLMENNLIQTFNTIFQDNIKLNAKEPNPLACFVQKNNLFYIYENKTNGWRLFTIEEFISILRKIHSKLLIELFEWYKSHAEKIKMDEKTDKIYQTALLKLMSIDFVPQCNIITQIRQFLYNYLKIDINKI